MDNLVIENAQLIFKNFSGKEGTFNPKGQRNFCVILDPEVAKNLKKDGWNVKELKPREEGDIPTQILKVNVKFGHRPPNIVIVSTGGKSRIDESEVNMLDWAEIEKVDLTINPYEWEPGKFSAYLKSLYATIEVDPLEEKYSDVKDSAKTCIGGCGNCDVCDHDGPCNGD